MERTSFIVPHGHVQARAYICIPVDESMATRSSVMGTLMECDGVVQLPADVDINDLLTWTDFHPQNASTFSAEQLSHALKIGDQMGDKKSTEFARAMAEKLMDSTWLHGPERDSLQTIFLSLNANLQGLICQYLVPSQRIISVVASRWPLAMQLVYMDSVIETGSLEIPVRENAQTTQDILSVLSRTSKPSKGLSKLSIFSPISPSTAAVVALALLHHQTSINSLELPSLAPQAMINILPAISQLSQLTYMQLNFRHYTLRHPTAVHENQSTERDTIDALAKTISKLPSLASFTFETMTLPSPEYSPTPPPRKLPRLASAGSTPPALSLDPVIKALAAAPSLTSLALSCATASEDLAPVACSGIKGPFLRLEQLNIRLCKFLLPYTVNLPLCPIFLPVSPLPALSSLRFENEATSAAEVALVPGLLQQTALKSAVIQFHDLDRHTTGILSTGMQALTALAHLLVSFSHNLATSPDLVHKVIQGIAQLQGLTRLDIVVPKIDTENHAGWSQAHVDETLMTPLSRLASLKELSCRFDVHSDTITDPGGMPGESLVAHVLPVLTQLTYLQLIAIDGQDEECDLAVAILAGLPPLPELRHLHVAAIFFHSHPQAKHWLETLDLKRMTHLDLSICPIHEETLQCLAQCLRGAHEMQMVRINATGGEVEAGWTQGILGMPCRGTYVFECPGSDEEGLHQLEPMLEEQGFVFEQSYHELIRFRYPRSGNGAAPADAAVVSPESVVM